MPPLLKARKWWHVTPVGLPAASGSPVPLLLHHGDRLCTITPRLRRAPLLRLDGIAAVMRLIAHHGMRRVVGVGRDRPLHLPG